MQASARRRMATRRCTTWDDEAGEHAADRGSRELRGRCEGRTDGGRPDVLSRMAATKTKQENAPHTEASRGQRGRRESVTSGGMGLPRQFRCLVYTVSLMSYMSVFSMESRRQGQQLQQGLQGRQGQHAGAARAARAAARAARAAWAARPPVVQWGTPRKCVLFVLHALTWRRSGQQKKHLENGAGAALRFPRFVAKKFP
eukprot:gene5779-biopygen8804